MPSDQSTWLIAVPQDGDSEGLFPELKGKLSQQSRSAGNSIAELGIPSFKVTSVLSDTRMSEFTPFYSLDGNSGLADCTLRRASKAGCSVHGDSGQDGGHSA